MPKFIIRWNVGYGENAEIVDVSTAAKADVAAYETAYEEFANNADYSSEPYTKERAIELSLEDEEE